VSSPHDPACDVAHDSSPQPMDGRVLIAVFASPVAQHVLHFAGHAGFRTVLVEPELARLLEARRLGAEVHRRTDDAPLGPDTDVVVTDHHRGELGAVVRDVLAGKTGWVGVIGSPRHVGPHVAALAQLGVPAQDIARVHWPVGLNIGSRAPAEIAIATLAGLIAHRNGRPGGFAF
jgi:xanthine dehydrogenase accessory factor